jgi:WD40 repeat protein
LVYTDSITKGTVKVYDAWNLRQSSVFEAHQAPILKMSMNYQGSKLVTTSCKGTIIRVFSLPKGQKLYTFKRGSSNSMIYSLTFSRQGNFVVASSENGTVHLFQLPQKPDEIEADNSNEDDENYSEISINQEVDKDCHVCSISSWIQTCFPVNYNELVSSKKSDYRLTSEDLAVPNICCMDRNENNIIMFLKRGEFKMFSMDSGKLTQDMDFDADF